MFLLPHFGHILFLEKAKNKKTRHANIKKGLNILLNDFILIPYPNIKVPKKPLPTE